MPTLPATRRATRALFAILLAVAGCGPQVPRITPVDEEFNRMMLDDGRLDPRLYDMRERLQYFEAAHLETLPTSAARVALGDFIRTHYALDDMARLDAMGVLVYRSSIFISYDHLVHDSARNNEGGLLWEQGGRTVAQVRFEKVGQGPQWTRDMVLYHDGAIVLDETETADGSRFFHH